MPFSASLSGTSGQRRPSQRQNSSRKRTLHDFEESEEVQSRNLSYLANNVVRYIVIVGGSNIPIKRSDIIKNCLSNSNVSANAIFDKARAILKKVYGYELLDCLTKNAKMYVLRNMLISLEEKNAKEIPTDSDKVLKFLILSHIFMSGESSTDSSLFTFLQCCKIDPTALHPIYGNVMDFINNKMTREKLITSHISDETRKVSYSWGSNAELTVSKMEILKFFASFSNKNVKSWSSHYEDALEQMNDWNSDEEENLQE